MDELGTIGNMGAESDLLFFIALFWGLTEAARRIAQRIPGKRGDELTNKLEGYARQALDFVAGRHGAPGDSGAVKPDRD